MKKRYLFITVIVSVVILVGYFVFVHLNNLSPKKGFIYKNYCPGGVAERKYFSDENGQKTDAIRTTIEEWKNLSIN